LNGTHLINRPLKKSRKSLEVRNGILLSYPDFNKPDSFHLYTDASDHQLGAVITQDKKPAAFYSRKFNTAQKKYTTTERELLPAIETCKEYKNILLGYYYPIIVFTDHKNNTFNGLKLHASDCILRTCRLLLLEEYGVTYEYFPGYKNLNTIAEALIHLTVDNLLSISDNSSIIIIK
jgi:hypothetical protein